MTSIPGRMFEFGQDSLYVCFNSTGFTEEEKITRFIIEHVILFIYLFIHFLKSPFRIMALHRNIFIINEYSIIAWESGLVSRCLLRKFKFRVGLLLDCLPPKFKEAILSCYLTHIWRQKRSTHTSQKSICSKVNATD